MAIFSFSDSANKRESASNQELFCTISENQIKFNKCIKCPGLCLKCIKNIFDISNENLKNTSLRVVYVISGKIKLFFPQIKAEKLLDTGVMLIAHDTKFVIERGNELPANFIIRDLDEMAEEKQVKCSFG